MADPAALTDPAVAAGIIAAVGAIGLTVRSRIVAKRPEPTAEDRQLWCTRAAVAATEKALFLGDEDEQRAVIDLRPPYLRVEIDLTNAQPPGHLVVTERSTSESPDETSSASKTRRVEIDLSNNDEPTINLDPAPDRQTSGQPGKPT